MLKCCLSRVVWKAPQLESLRKKRTLKTGCSSVVPVFSSVSACAKDPSHQLWQCSGFVFICTILPYVSNAIHIFWRYEFTKLIFVQSVHCTASKSSRLQIVHNDKWSPPFREYMSKICHAIGTVPIQKDNSYSPCPVLAPFQNSVSFRNLRKCRSSQSTLGLRNPPSTPSLR